MKPAINFAILLTSSVLLSTSSFATSDAMFDPSQITGSVSKQSPQLPQVPFDQQELAAISQRLTGVIANLNNGSKPGEIAQELTDIGMSLVGTQPKITSALSTLNEPKLMATKSKLPVPSKDTSDLPDLSSIGNIAGTLFNIVKSPEFLSNAESAVSMLISAQSQLSTLQGQLAPLLNLLK